MTSYDLVLKGGMVYDPCTGLIEEEDVAVKDGKIAARGQGIASDADTIIEAEGCIVAPGLIDLHCLAYIPHVSLSGERFASYNKCGRTHVSLRGDHGGGCRNLWVAEFRGF